MRLRQIRTIFGKEMLETIRDRRTLLAMIGIPVLLYPLLAIGISQLVQMQLARMTKEKIRLVILEDDGGLVEALRDDPRVEMKRAKDQEEAVRLLKAGELDAVIVVGRVQRGEPVEVRLLYTVTEDRSMMSRGRLTNMLRRITVGGMVERLKAKQLTLKKVQPLRVVTANVNPQLRGAFTFGRLIAFMLVLLAVTFPFHPALDLGAGEKERGTLETLLVSPAARREIVLGKYLAVFTVGLFGSLLNLGSMALTFGYFADMTKQAAMTKTAHFEQNREANEKLGPDFLLDELEEAPKYDFSIGWGALGRILLALVPLVSLFAAISLMLSMLAGSYKEGQNYLTPLLVIVMPLSMVAMIPSLHLDLTNAWIPVSNVVLLVKDLFIEKLDPVAFSAALGFTLLYAVVSLWATVQVCGRESVLFREVGSVKIGMRPTHTRDVPTPVAALIIFGLAMILVGMVNQKLGLVVLERFPRWGFPLGTALGLSLVGLLAVGAVWYNRARYETALALRRPPLLGMGAALLLGVGGAMAFTPLLPWMLDYFPALKKQLEALKGMEKLLSSMPTWLKVVVLALLPALFEELLFRGVLLQSFLRVMRPGWAILLVSLMFAVAHQHFLRYPATFSVGLLLGWVVWRTGSIWVAVALHFAWNLTSAVLTPAMLDPKAKGLPGWWVPTALLLLAAGAALFLRVRSVGDADSAGDAHLSSEPG